MDELQRHGTNVVDIIGEAAWDNTGHSVALSSDEV